MIDIDENIKSRIRQYEKALQLSGNTDGFFRHLSGRKIMIRTMDYLTKFLGGNSFYAVLKNDHTTVYHLIIATNKIVLSHNKTNKIIIDNPTLEISNNEDLDIYYLDDDKNTKLLSINILLDMSRDGKTSEQMTMEESILEGLENE